MAASIHQHAYLAVHFSGDLGELSREVLSDDLAWWDAPFVELFESVNLVGLKPLKVSFYSTNNFSSVLPDCTPTVL